MEKYTCYICDDIMDFGKFRAKDKCHNCFLLQEECEWEEEFICYRCGRKCGCSKWDNRKWTYEDYVKACQIESKKKLEEEESKFIEEIEKVCIKYNIGMRPYSFKYNSDSSIEYKNTHTNWKGSYD